MFNMIYMCFLGTISLFITGYGCYMIVSGLDRIPYGYVDNKKKVKALLRMFIGLFITLISMCVAISQIS